MTALHAIRFREELEMRCEACQDWWPLTPEFWRPIRGLNRCLACIRESDVAQHRKFRKPTPRKPKTWQSILRKRLLNRAAQARYYRAHSDELRAKRRASYAARRAA
jgi:hypothetical protein